MAKAWDYIKLYDDDIRESLEDDLRSAENKIETAREELKAPKPDFFKVCKLAREANESADKILVQARDEHDSAERLRAKAISSRRDANARVSIAMKYIEDHHPVVHQEARNYLINAVEALRQADTATDVNSQISLAAASESDANQAYSLAQSDVRNTTRSIPTIIIPPVIYPPMGRPPVNRPPEDPFRSGGGGFQGLGNQSSG